jgi:SsrA-binding protein
MKTERKALFSFYMNFDLTAELSVKNRKAYYLYELIDKYQAGIELTGTEIKSIRAGKVNLSDAYCVFENHELFVRGIHIAEYEQRGYVNHLPTRDRKLLLTRRELTRLERSVNEKGLTLVATRLYLNEKALVKVEIALARGKKQYDHREDLKRKDTNRELDRMRKKR